MRKTVVSSWNDFDPLEHVIVGRADFTCIPPSEPATEAKIPEDSDMRGMWGPRPLETVEKANAELDHLVSVLEKRGIRVDQPTPIQWNQAVVTPDFMTGSSFGCMPPRDVLLTVGKEILSAPMSFRCRYWEYLAYHPLMQRYFDEDPEFRWEQAPRPRLTDASYKAGYFDEITIEERLARTAALDFVTTEHERLFDAADVLRIGRDLFCQHGLTTNRRGMEWLQRHFPDHRVHAVNFPGDPYPNPHRRDVRAVAPGAHHQQSEAPVARRPARDLRGQRLGDHRCRPACPQPAAAVVLLERVAVDERARARPEDGRRRGQRGVSAGTARRARFRGDPGTVPRRVPLRRRAALRHRRRLPPRRLRGLLPEAGPGDADQADSDRSLAPAAANGRGLRGRPLPAHGALDARPIPSLPVSCLPARLPRSCR